MRKIILFTLLATVTMAFAQTRRMKLYFNTGSVIIYNVDDLDSLVWEVDEDDAPYYNNDTKETVDLGLSVKWATCNVGANSPEEYGDYFAWGETEPKSSYDFTTYKWCNGSYNTLTKYYYRSIVFAQRCSYFPSRSWSAFPCEPRQRRLVRQLLVGFALREPPVLRIEHALRIVRREQQSQRP